MHKVRISTFVIFITGLALVFLAGFKPIGIDRDSLNYINMIQTPFAVDNLYLREPAFNLIQIINNIVFENSITTFFVIFALLGVTIKLIAIIRGSLYPILSLAIYIFFYYILHDLTQIRVGVASGLFLLAINDRVNERNKKALIKTLVAVCFHYSAIMAFVIFAINKNRINKGFYLLLPVIGIASTLFINATVLSFVIQFLPDFISLKIALYLTVQKNDMLNQINVFNFYYSTLLIIYTSLILFIGKNTNKRDIIYIKLLGLGLFFFYAMSFIPVMAFRMSEFYCIVIVILFANITDYFKQPILYQTLIMMFGIVYFISQGLMHNINF